MQTLGCRNSQKDLLTIKQQNDKDISIKEKLNESINEFCKINH